MTENQKKRMEKLKADVAYLKNNLASARRENRQIKAAYFKLEKRFALHWDRLGYLREKLNR